MNIIQILRKLADGGDITSWQEREALRAAADFVESIEIDNTAGVMDKNPGFAYQGYCSCYGNVDVETLRKLGFESIIPRRQGQ